MSFSQQNRRTEMAEINMTPLIDVMLVLLIVFMISAPMMTTGVEVNLPQSKTGRSLESSALTITVAADGTIQFEQLILSADALRQELDRQAKANLQRPILIRADRNLNYGEVIKIVDYVKEAGFVKVGFITGGEMPTVARPPQKKKT